MACYRSLCAVGAEEVANGRLLDNIRRLKCFGLTLVRLDLRQEAARHTEVADAVYAVTSLSLSSLIFFFFFFLSTQYLGLGSYEEWDEEKRQAFLAQELKGRRPLLPRDFPCNPVCANLILLNFKANFFKTKKKKN